MVESTEAGLEQADCRTAEQIEELRSQQDELLAFQQGALFAFETLFRRYQREVFGWILLPPYAAARLRTAPELPSGVGADPVWKYIVGFVTQVLGIA